MVEKKSQTFSPFITRIDAPAKSDFDKYYLDPEYKEVYRKAGVDKDGQEFGVAEIVCVISKRDISEYINSQADSVGVASYMRALASQGDSLDNYHTEVDGEKVVDYTNCPETLADTMMLGEKAKQAFANLDPAIKDGHTTIDGFLNSLTQEKLDAYIKGKVDALMPKQGNENAGGE